MFILKKTFIVFTILFVNSCKSQDINIENDVKKCINTSVNHDLKMINGKDHFEFYKVMNKIEQKLINLGYLKDKSQKSYFNLFNKLIKNKKVLNKDYKSIIKIADDYGLEADSFIINDAIFAQCPYKTVKKYNLKKNYPLYKQGFATNKMFNNGYYVIKNIKDVLYSIDKEQFKKDVYRAPIVYLVLINLKYKYESKSY